MTPAELISLAAVLLTGAGLIANFLALIASAQAQAKFQGQVQKQLEELKEEYAIAREQRQYIIPQQITDLQSISEWLIKGYNLGSEIYVFRMNTEIGHNQLPSYVESRQSQLKTAFQHWSDEQNRCSTIALLYDPTSPEVVEDFKIVSLWSSGQNTAVPKHLSALMQGMFFLVLKQESWSYKNTADALQDLALMHQVFLAGTQAIDQIKRNLFANK